jgi:glycogen synthase
MRRDRRTGWRALMQAAMRRDASWNASAREYLQLYRAVARAR